jgi:cytochrome c oxidase subunit 4
MEAAQEQHGHEDIAKHVRVYVMVFVALACLTAVTVGVSYIHMGSHWMNIVVALVIASIKASLVAAYFMHLVSEKKVIYAVLALTALFFLFVLFIPLFTVAETRV